MIPFVNSYFGIKKNVEFINDSVNNRSALERLYSALYQNISLGGKITYQDINKEFNIEEKEIQTDPIELTLSNSETQIINIKNKTRILVTTQYKSTSGDYSVYIYYGDKTIFNEDNLSANKSFTIPSTYVYNSETNTSHYGEYKIVITCNSCDVDTSISYEKQLHRKILVTDNNNIIRNIILDNTNNLTDIYQTKS
jgi:5-keto 4-deoxyuronate isomerase